VAIFGNPPSRIPARQSLPSDRRDYRHLPGYQIDHRVPLSKAGADEPANMQWLSVDANRAKTARERR